MMEGTSLLEEFEQGPTTCMLGFLDLSGITDIMWMLPSHQNFWVPPFPVAAKGLVNHRVASPAREAADHCYHRIRNHSGEPNVHLCRHYHCYHQITNTHTYIYIYIYVFIYIRSSISSKIVQNFRSTIHRFDSLTNRFQNSLSCDVDENSNKPDFQELDLGSPVSPLRIHPAGNSLTTTINSSSISSGSFFDRNPRNLVPNVRILSLSLALKISPNSTNAKFPINSIMFLP
ncbi:hypothetical protein LguiA_031951 [Lonicera macranthoides]